MGLKDRLKSANDRTGDPLSLFTRFGVIENPFPPAGQSSSNPHLRSSIDDEIDTKIEIFIRDKQSQVVVIEGTQGVGKTNVLNFYERELTEVLPPLGGYYVIRYLADPEASFDGTLRRLFQELGQEHLEKLGEVLAESPNEQEIIEVARSHEMRIALRHLSKQRGQPEVAGPMLEWLLGLRVLNRHKQSLGVQFRLDTVESKTLALRDLVFCSSSAKILNGIFLLLDELEKQDGVLSPIYVVRYLSAIRAIIDALPSHLFLMMAVTPDALRRYSLALPAFQSRLQDRLQIEPLSNVSEALELAHFYMSQARTKAKLHKSTDAPGTVGPILNDSKIEQIFREQLQGAEKRGDRGVRQREFLHALHREAETVIQTPST